MIHYQLQCDQGHGFDGWFKDSTSFDRQAEAKLVTCTICGSPKVTRALMTPALGRGARNDAVASGQEASPPALPSSASDRPMSAVPTAQHAASANNTGPERLRSLLQRLRAEVETNCDYVGPDFAEEARRIHYGETKAHNIYGEATRDQAEALADEGVEFGLIPWLPPTDS